MNISKVESKCPRTEDVKWPSWNYSVRGRWAYLWIEEDWVYQ